MRIRGLQAGPEAPQAHQTAAASSPLPASCFLCKGKKTKRERESSRGSDERFYAGGRDDNFKEDVVHPSLQALIDDRTSSEPLFLRGYRHQVKFATWKRNLGRDFRWSEESERILSFDVHRLEENQCALSNQMTESCTHRESNVRSHKEDSGDLLLMACPPGKWLKCERFYALWTLSWNVRGLGSRNKRRMVKDFLRSENPDVVMIQETKKENVIEGLWVVSGRSEIRIGLLFRRLGHQVGF
ncbi:hypothetical protein CK203_113432 [Vitis vinifera]|uniref:Endonuclease/exonuclease/phosphatase domain-containing protein n=1 Tax=Vitis vinifera TaxID=29760 RepID=A0A438BPP4_VITVI|nr:hypothetical protein CK203_113432 [Vitis vinifera]